MIPFSKIPGNLQVPLFHSELFINGGDFSTSSIPTPTLCEPLGFQSQDTDLPPANYTFEYQVNGEARTYSYLAGNVTSVGSLFSYLLSEDLSPVVMVGSGGGTGHFQFIYATGFAIYAAQGDGDPQTIVFTSLKQDGSEILPDVLGESSVTVHACGQQDFPGV